MGSGGAGSSVRRDMKNNNAMTRAKVTIEPTARKRESIYTKYEFYRGSVLLGRHRDGCASWCKW